MFGAASEAEGSGFGGRGVGLIGAAQVPLVGFVPWGMVEGRHALWEPEADGRVAPHVEKLPLEDFQTHEKHFHAVCVLCVVCWGVLVVVVVVVVVCR
eukprot:2238886-Rhodomonas_salina.1